MLEARRVTFISPAILQSVQEDLTGRRHQKDVAVIGDPRAAQMCVTEAVDYGVGVVITRAAVPTRESCIRTELDHAERHNRAWKRVAVPGGADEWIYVMCEILLSGNRERK